MIFLLNAGEEQKQANCLVFQFRRKNSSDEKSTWFDRPWNFKINSENTFSTTK